MRQKAGEEPGNEAFLLEISLNQSINQLCLACCLSLALASYSPFLNLRLLKWWTATLLNLGLSALY